MLLIVVGKCRRRPFDSLARGGRERNFVLEEVGTGIYRGGRNRNIYIDLIPDFLEQEGREKRERRGARAKTCGGGRNGVPKHHIHNII